MPRGNTLVLLLAYMKKLWKSESFHGVASVSSSDISSSNIPSPSSGPGTRIHGRDVTPCCDGDGDSDRDLNLTCQRLRLARPGVTTRGVRVTTRRDRIVALAPCRGGAALRVH